MSVERFLVPEETNVELIRLYFQALFRKMVTPVWCPLPYLVAVHHVNRFMYTQTPPTPAREGGGHCKLRATILRQVLAANDQVRLCNNGSRGIRQS